MKSSRALRLYVAALFALPSAAALAEPSGDEEDLTLVYGGASSVSIATGNALSLRRAPAVAAVVTAADIANMGATDLDHVLETVAGIHVGRSANTHAPLYVVRGVYSTQAPQVLVLQNGVPITILFTGNKGNLWGGYPVELISRIEIIRGPGSALYGSDAYAGVINIITKGPAEAAGTEFGARLGSFRTRDAWVQHGGNSGPVEVQAYVRVGGTDGFRGVVAADAQTRNDALFGTRASLAPGPVDTGNRAVDANLELAYGDIRARLNYKLRDDVGPGAGIASALDPSGHGRSERFITNLAWTAPEFGPDWGVGLSLNTQQYAQEIPTPYVLLPPGARLPTGLFPNGMLGAPEVWERHVRLGAYADYSGFAGHHVRIGAGHDDLHMYRTRERRNFSYAPNGTPIPQAALTDFYGPAMFLEPQRRRIDYLYAQDEWQLAKDWNLTAGVRHDRYSDFGGTTNPRLALVWDASFDLTAKLLYGRAFRAPSFNEAYSGANPVALGNANLKPETDGTLEAVFAWQAQSELQANLTLYRYSMGNIIRLVPRAVAGTGAVYQNTGSQSGRGVELEGAWRASPDLRVTANYAWQRSIDKATNTDAGYAPRNHLHGRAEWRFSRGYMLSPQLNWVAGRRRPAGDARAPVADYKTVDLSLSSPHGKRHWNVTVAVRNLFNADAREPSAAPGLALPFDLPTAGRAVSVQASYGL
ncbi:TonB-dependent receptor plug domain-containing protein [Pseudoduganella namucuonensis]|uniref:Iron complex outermembrane recepter protein n=1 Tax=Pseudoduganella namucuonensis TaxID=1035707 RepID=A0A1I7HF01_9BURK|nr:TonB-dependent receptor [Pseudoduganella namucuonensis]SFU59119.1 iron complex outermembrane recepter protein [Pseudoduganella namucuonensis]